ncbi:hypothetical protein ILYODFUR_012260 [Ilyodon furcidens]|uniref:Uncharacterized protein n=1 Tax=Ilyodon furcidens TaxID=33524 RepID=A0ABV0UST0_9TELE
MKLSVKHSAELMSTYNTPLRVNVRSEVTRCIPLLSSASIRSDSVLIRKFVQRYISSYEVADFLVILEMEILSRLFKDLPQFLCHSFSVRFVYVTSCKIKE